MIKRKENLTHSEMLSIAQSFARYPHASASFDGFKDEKMIMRYIELSTSVMKVYCDIYSLDDHAYMMISNESTITPIGQYVRLLWGFSFILGPWRMYKMMDHGTQIGDPQEVVLRKKKKRFIHIELLAIQQAFWGQGLMRQLIEYVKQMAKERDCLCIVETDEKVKMEKYIHLGFRLKKVRNLHDDMNLYDLYYDPTEDCDKLEQEERKNEQKRTQ